MCFAQGKATCSESHGSFRHFSARIKSEGKFYLCKLSALHRYYPA